MSANVLMVGGFNDGERARITAACDTLSVDGPAAIADLDEAARAGIRAVMVKGHAPFGGAAMDPLPNLGVIANFGVGYDAIDVTAASERGIKVTNTPDVLNDDVADLAVAMMLAQARDMVNGHQLVVSGDWAKGALPLNRKLSGGTVGIVGLGRIGREIADRLAAFKMQIHYTSRSEKQTPGWTFHSDVVAMAQQVDWLVVALVGGPETENHVNRAVLEALGPKGVIVNISRGTTIDEGAMLDLLESGGLGGAALDVFVNEPDIDPRWKTAPNCHLQPHQGSGTYETRQAMAELQLSNVTAFLKGEALVTPVN